MRSLYDQPGLRGVAMAPPFVADTDAGTLSYNSQKADLQLFRLLTRCLHTWGAGCGYRLLRQ